MIFAGTSWCFSVHAGGRLPVAMPHGSVFPARSGRVAALALPPKNKPAGQGLAGSEPNSECRALRLYFIA
jgi:hypothetical protein